MHMKKATQRNPRKSARSGRISDLPPSEARSLLLKLEQLRRENRTFDGYTEAEAVENQREHKPSMLSPIAYVVVKKLVKYLDIEIEQLHGSQRGEPYPLMFPGGFVQLVGLVIEFEEARLL